MRVREVMSRDVESIKADDTVQHAAARMLALDVGSLPVCEDDRVVGMLTDRDIVLRAVPTGESPTELRVSDVMTRDVVTCLEDQLVTEATQLMEENQIRRVVVVDKDRRVVGIVSLGDIATETGDEDLAGNTLESVSEPTATNR